MITIGLAASPILERQAVNTNDITLADQFFYAACLSSGKGEIDRETGKLIKRSLEERASETHAERRNAKNREKFGSARNEAERVELAFRETLGKTHGVERAYDGYVLLYKEARARVLRRLFGGAESPAEVQERWHELYTQPLRHLTPLRRLALFNFSLGAPIRTEGQTLVDRNMLIDVANQLRLETPGDIHKYPQNGPYKLLLWEAGQEGGFDVEMMNLYLETVRPALLAGHCTPRLWVNNMHASASSRPEVLDGTIRSDIGWVIRQAAEELDFEPSMILSVKVHHSIRHAIGTLLVRKNMIAQAKVLLHHAPNSTEAQKTYFAGDRDASTHSLRAEGARLATLSGTVAKPERSNQDDVRRELREEVRAEVLREMKAKFLAELHEELKE